MAQPQLRTATTVWRAKLFGKFEFSRDGVPLPPLRSAKTADLLAVLTLQLGHNLSKLTLAEEFWPDTEEHKQSQNLRQCLASITAALEEPGVLISGRGFIELSHDHVATDLQDFDYFASHYGDLKGEFRQRALESAFALVTGPLLKDHDHPIIIPERLRVEESYATVTLDFIKHLIGEGDPRKAAQVGRRALTISPEREDIHIGLIEAYGAAELTSEALKQFEFLEQMLDEHWGESPSDAARQALERLPTPSHARRDPSNHIPKPVQRIYIRGRREELDFLTNYCQQRNNGFLLTLCGAGGSGKTTIAHALKERLGFPKDFYFVELADLRDSQLIASRTLAAIGLAASDGPAAMSSLANAISNSGVLVLDNAEHLSEGVAAFVQELLALNSEVRIIVTSRVALELPAEILVPIGALPMPDVEQSLAQLQSNPCIELFVRQSQLLRSTFRLRPENARATIQICQRLEGMPLAIELAAAQTTVYSPAQIASRLEKGILSLESTQRARLERHRSVERSVSWSFDLLSDEQKEALCRLSVFRGTFSVDAAEAILTDLEAAPLLSALSRSSLLERRDSAKEVRFALLVPIRLFALAKLQEFGLERQTRDALHDFACYLSDRLKWEFNGSNPREAIDQTEADFEIFRTAFEDRSSDPNKEAEKIRMVGDLAAFFGARGLPSAAFKNLYDRFSAIRDNLEPPNFVRASYGAAIATLFQQNFVRATEILDKSIEDLRANDTVDRAGLINLRLLANIMSPTHLTCESDNLRMIGLGREALSNIVGITNVSYWSPELLRVTLLSNIASTYRRMDRPEEALDAVQNAIALGQGVIPKRTYCFLTLSVADINMDLGRLDEAWIACMEAIRAFEDAGFDEPARQARGTAMTIAVRQGRIEDAWNSLQAVFESGYFFDRDRVFRDHLVGLAIVVAAAGNEELSLELVRLATRAGFVRQDWHRVNQPEIGVLLPVLKEITVPGEVTAEEVRRLYEQVCHYMERRFRKESDPETASQ
ncbi:MAG: AAA family ATPase [Fimbriimonadaceae bacterium]|nr:AAA family ATPase [Fimbriimonadaceae bacterium]